METDVGGGTSPCPSEGGESLTGYSRGRSVIPQPISLKSGESLTGYSRGRSIIPQPISLK